MAALFVCVCVFFWQCSASNILRQSIFVNFQSNPADTERLNLFEAYEPNGNGVVHSVPFIHSNFSWRPVFFSWFAHHSLSLLLSIKMLPLWKFVDYLVTKNQTTFHCDENMEIFLEFFRHVDSDECNACYFSQTSHWQVKENILTSGRVSFSLKHALKRTNIIMYEYRRFL